MAKKRNYKKKSRKINVSRRKISRLEKAFWWVVNALLTISLSGLTIALFIESGPIPSWMWIAEAGIVVSLFFIIYFGKFVTDESLALNKKM